jgi:hypothetical protein
MDIQSGYGAHPASYPVVMEAFGFPPRLKLPEREAENMAGKLERTKNLSVGAVSVNISITDEIVTLL